ncbi:hypothetical protein ACWCPI_04905 [Streptomyces sp. NPDC001920]
MRVMRALVRHELRLLVCLGLWAVRRRHVPEGGLAFGHARGQGPMMFGFGFVCVVESLTMSVLLRDFPAVRRMWFALDVYTVVLLVGLHAASVVRPHVLGSGFLRVRRGVHLDLRIPLEKIAGVRRELRTTHERADGEFDVAVGSQTSVTLELAEPVPCFTFLGRRRDVHLVRFHADDADRVVAEIREATAGMPPRGGAYQHP